MATFSIENLNATCMNLSTKTVAANVSYKDDFHLVVVDVVHDLPGAEDNSFDVSCQVTWYNGEVKRSPILFTDDYGNEEEVFSRMVTDPEYDFTTQDIVIARLQVKAVAEALIKELEGNILSDLTPPSRIDHQINILTRIVKSLDDADYHLMNLSNYSEGTDVNRADRIATPAGHALELAKRRLSTLKRSYNDPMNHGINS